LQIQLVLARWRELGILQAVGFSPLKILLHFGIRLYTILAAGVGIAAVAVSILPFARSASMFVFAAGVAVVAASMAALPVLLWPLAQAPAQLLRLSA
jgi:ABC-type antimicrobial peptide transport system permease subunit